MIDTRLAIIIVLEVIFTLFIAWGILHEERLVRFERRLWRLFKAVLRALYFTVKERAR